MTTTSARELYRRHLRKWRNAGIDVFVIPKPGPVHGMSWASKARNAKHDIKTDLFINMHGSINSPLWLFVLLHEVAHHTLLHTTVWTSAPAWVREFEADKRALDLIAVEQPYVLPICQRASKDHIAPLMQAYIDAGITHHVDLTIADWAGCSMPDQMRADLIERDA